MAAKESSQTLQVGDRVKVLRSANWHGRIVEFRGPLGAGGLLVLTPLLLPNSHGWTGHERGVGVIPGRDVQRGQRGDVAGDGVAQSERF